MNVPASRGLLLLHCPGICLHLAMCTSNFSTGLFRWVESTEGLLQVTTAALKAQCSSAGTVSVTMPKATKV